MPSFDDLDKARIVQSSDVEATEGDELLQRLIQSNEWLFEALLDLSDKISSNSANSSMRFIGTSGLQPNSAEYALSKLTETRDFSNEMRSLVPGYLSDAERQKIRDNFAQTEQEIRQHLQNVKDIVSQGGTPTESPDDIQEQLRQEQEERLRFEEESRHQQNLSQTMYQQFASSVGGGIAFGGGLIEAGASSLLPVANQFQQEFVGEARDATSRAFGGGEIGGLIANLVPVFANTTQSLTKLAAGSIGMSTAIGTLIPLVGTAVVAFGMFEAFSFLEKKLDYSKEVLRSSPSGFDSLNDFTGAQNLGHYALAMKSNLINTKSDDDVNRLMSSVLSTRPKGVNALSAQNMGYIYGLLNDFGMDSSKSAGVTKSMTKDLGMDFDESKFALLDLANTAKAHSLDLGSYAEKITQVAVSLRGLGVTVAQVNSTFSKYADMSFASGQKLNQDEAVRATQMELSVGNKLDPGQGTYLAMTTAKDFKVGPSLGIEGTGEDTLGELVGQGGLNSLKAGYLAKLADPSKLFMAEGQSSLKFIDTALKGTGSEDDNTLKMFMLGDSMKKKGLVGDISDPATQALLKKIIDFQGKDINKISTEIGKELKRISPQPLDKLIQSIGKDFKDSFGKVHEQLSSRVNMMKGWAEIFEDIRELLIGTFLPIAEFMQIKIAGIATFITTLFKTGNLDSSLSSMNSVEKKFADIYKDINESEDVKEIFSKSKIGSELKKNLIDPLGSASTGNVMQANIEKGVKTFFDHVLDTLFWGADNDPRYPKSASGMTLPGNMPNHLPSKAGLVNLSNIPHENLWYSRADSYSKSHGYSATPQAAALAINLNNAGLSFKPQISAAYSNAGHSDGHGGEHKHGNALDLGLAGMTSSQQIELAKYLAKNPFVKDVGVNAKLGLGRYLGDKYRPLGGHMDHFHVRAKSGLELPYGSPNKIHGGMSHSHTSSSKQINVDATLQPASSKSSPKPIRTVEKAVTNGRYRS